MQTHHLLVSTLVLCSISACGNPTFLGEPDAHAPPTILHAASDPPPAAVESSEPGEGMNGTVLGMRLKVYPNSSTGTKLASGTVAAGIELEKTTIIGYSGGVKLTGGSFNEAIIPATLNDISTTVKIKGYSSSGIPDVNYYQIQIEKDGGYKDMCKSNLAIAVAGTWDRSGAYTPPGTGAGYVFTFACTGSAITKCIDQPGTQYKPWLSTPYNTVERDLHVACTRMMRADYCGDGQSHTSAGVWITFKDKSKHPTYVSSSPPGGGALVWQFEAVWSTAGAECVYNPRVAGFSLCPGGRNLIRNDCQTAIPWGTGAGAGKALIKNQSNAHWMRLDPEPACPGCPARGPCPICVLD